ncbi:MAG: SNF2-related protein, partial [Sinobacteraceae bacterium]|nr:SNF2-related protein [Nevskiaceae bacterium]
MITPYHAKYYAHALTCHKVSDGVGRLSQSLFDASVDLNPHQIEAALFALRNPLQEGVLLADEVGLGKTIEAALVLCQLWAERRRRLLVICPASLRKQWAQELAEKFALLATIVDRTWLRSHTTDQPAAALRSLAGKQVVILSYSFAAKLETELRAIIWDAVVIDEAHKLRNAHRANNRIGQALCRALSGRKKLLLTATPLQNSLMELYGMSTLIDEHLFGDAKAFRQQFVNNAGGIVDLRDRLATFVHRTLRHDVLEYINYTERHTLTQPFEPTPAEQDLYDRVSTFLQREDSYALPKQQRHLVSLILRKLLASSPIAIAGTLATIRERLMKTQDEVETGPLQLAEQVVLDEDIDEEYLEDSDDEVRPENDQISDKEHRCPDIIADEIAELTTIIDAASTLHVDTKANALLKAIDLGFRHMAKLGGPRKAIIFTESRRTQNYLYEFLEQHGHTGKLVKFSGTNKSEADTAIYRQWLSEYAGTDRITGSPQVDRCTALIDHFRKVDGSGADIMIATEAAGEGV